METYVCTACGSGYAPKRKPAIGQRNYCGDADCLKARARDAKRDQRTREFKPHCVTCRCGTRVKRRVLAKERVEETWSDGPQGPLENEGMLSELGRALHRELLRMDR